MKLKLELVPETAFCKNLRNRLGQSRWSSLSKQIRSAHHYTCEYCGAKEDKSKRFYTHLHEVWEYDDEKHIQRLARFECLCSNCHAIHHWGLSQIRGLDMGFLLKHASNVNGCTEEEFKSHVYDSFKLWRERSTQPSWNLDLGIYEELFK